MFALASPLHVVVSGDLDTDWLAIIVQILVPSLVGVAAAILAVFWTIRLQDRSTKKSLSKALGAEVGWILEEISRRQSAIAPRTEFTIADVRHLSSSSLVFQGSLDKLGLLDKATLTEVVVFYNSFHTLASDVQTLGSISTGSFEPVIGKGRSLIQKLNPGG